MADTAAPEKTVIKDFASMAIESMKTDPDLAKADPVQQEPKKEPIKEVKQDRGVPEGLFDKPKKDEPKSEPTSEVDAIAEPQFRDPKNKGGWDTLKSKAKDLETKYGEAQKKLADLEAKGKDTATIEAKLAKMEQDYAALSTKAAEYEGIVKKRWIEDDPEFNRKFVAGRNDLIEHAKKIARDSGLNPSDMEAALNLKGEAGVRALESAAEGMGAFQQGRLGQIVTAIEKLDAEAESLRGKPEDFLKARQEQEAVRQREEGERFRQSMSKAAQDAERVAGEKFIMAKKLDGADWWNKGIDEAFGKARKFWETNQDPNAAAVRNIKAELYDIAEPAFIDMRTERDTWKEKAEKHEAELNKLYGKNAPVLRGGGDGPKDSKPKDFASRVIEDSNLQGTGSRIDR